MHGSARQAKTSGMQLEALRHTGCRDATGFSVILLSGGHAPPARAWRPAVQALQLLGTRWSSVLGSVGAVYDSFGERDCGVTADGRWGFARCVTAHSIRRRRRGSSSFISFRRWRSLSGASFRNGPVLDWLLPAPAARKGGASHLRPEEPRVRMAASMYGDLRLTVADICHTLRISPTPFHPRRLGETCC